MANFDQLKQSVAALIRTNGAEEITGQIMQDVLLTIINSISGGYMFGGVAQHSGNVGNPDYNVFYLAGSGAYTGYGDAINIPDGCYGVFRYNGSWTQEVVDIGVHLTGTIREGETNGVTGDVINTALQQLFNNIMNILDTLTFTYNTPSGQQATKAMLDVIVTPTGGASHVLTTLTLVSATAAAAGLMSAEDKAKLDALWSSGYQFAGIATPSTTPVSTTSKIFYIATEAGTYFNAVTVTQGINIIYKSGDTWSVAQVVGIDNEPTAGSDRLVKSGGVFGELALGAVYDVSAKNPTAGPNSDGKWESLSALLSDANLNTLIPTSVRKGGMSIKYVQSSDNKYVQYRLMSDTFNTIVANWRGENTFVRTYHDISVSNYETYLPTLKLSDLPKNSVSYISDDISDSILDIPEVNSSQWIVETISGYGNVQYALLQRAYCIKKSKTYIRYGNTDSTYGYWKCDENIHTYHEIDSASYTEYLPSSKLSDLPKNSVSYISYDVSNNILDIPETNTSQWIIESISGYSKHNYAVLQRAYCVKNNRLYIRWSNSGTSFTDWSFIDVSNVPNYNIVKTYHDISTSNYETYLPTLKLSDLPKNAVSYISNDVSDNVLDIPLTNHSQWVIESISGYAAANYAILQRAYCANNGRTYTRWSANSVTFSDWKSEGNMSTLPLYDLSAFKKIGACGDSFTRGSIYKNGPWAGYRTDLAWHNVLARNHGFESHAFAAGGAHTRLFLSDSHCLPKLLKTERLELYFLFLGINDALLYENDSSYLGTIEDIHIGNPSQNADTFYGNYGKIIEKIQEYAPASLQIMMTVKFTPANETNIQIINTAIKAIAALYELPCIDLYNTPVYSTDMYIHSLYGGHPTPILHSAIAKQIDNSFYDCVLDNISYFNSYSTRCLSNGTFAERPTADVTIAGYVYWDSTNECVWECNGVGTNVDWIKIFEVKKDGDTANRPSNAAVGTCYYDETIGKPIWWNGSNWIDANGTTV